MAVKSIKPYVGVSRDVVANFAGKQIVFVCWEQHLLFSAPFMHVVEPEMRFGDLVAGPLSALLQPDPDAAAIDWAKVEWVKNKQPWTPDFNATVAENGIVHKEQLIFRTPGLNSLRAAA